MGMKQLELFPTVLKDNIGDIDIIFESGVITVTNLSTYLDNDDITFIIEKVNGKVKITNDTLSFSASDEMFSKVYEWIEELSSPENPWHLEKVETWLCNQNQDVRLDQIANEFPNYAIQAIVDCLEFEG